MSKKNKFNLSKLVQAGLIQDGSKVVFVSDPTKIAEVYKAENHEFRLRVKTKDYTVYTFAQECLGQDPPDHASRWIKVEGEGGETLYSLWTAEDEKD